MTPPAPASSSAPVGPSPFRATWRYWVAGVVVALAGVLLARGLAPRLATEARAWVEVVGQLMGLAGLLIIALGVRRRLRAAVAPSGPLALS